MYKILIVDDELLFRSKLRRMLAFSTEYQIHTQAANGMEAINQLEKSDIDIVVSDVQMPVLDGIALSLYLKENYPDIVLIVISNYDDFKYVKKILKNGAVDYLLKHEITFESLNETFINAIEIIKKRGNGPGIEHKDVELDNKSALRNRFVIRLLLGAYEDNNSIKKHINLLDIKLGTHNCVLIVMAIDRYKELTEDNQLDKINLIRYTIVHILQEILDEYENGIINHLNNEKFVMVLSFDNIRSRLQIDSSVSEICKRISGYIMNILNVSMSFSVSNIQDNLRDIPKVFEKTEKILCEKFYIGENSIIKNSSQFHEKESYEGLSSAYEKEIASHIKMKNRELIYTKIFEIFDDIKVQKLSISSCQIIFSDLLSLIKRSCNKYLIDYSKIYPKEKNPHKILSSYENIKEIQDWFIFIFGNLIDNIEGEYEDSYSEYVKSAINFVRNNFNNDISLPEVASNTGISSAYLSTQIKSETGISFCDILTNIRIKAAQTYLEEGKYTSQEVMDMCGFKDYSYFIKIFRKKTGFTPKEYSKQFK